jgi:hypothetical protein
MSITIENVRKVFIVVICLNSWDPWLQVHYLLFVNLFHRIFITVVQPYDWTKKRLGNTGILLADFFIEVLLFHLISLMLA